MPRWDGGVSWDAFSVPQKASGLPFDRGRAPVGPFNQKKTGAPHNVRRSCFRDQNRYALTVTTRPEKTMETVEQSLMRMFREGPEVSLKGSPTVSPMTAALWQSEPLPP